MKVLCFIKVRNGEKMDAAILNKTTKGMEVVLPAVLDLGQAEKLWVLFGQVIDTGSDVDVDASRVERVSTAPIQIIMSAAMAIEKNKFNFIIKKSSDAFMAGIQELGVESHYAKWRDG